MIVHLANMLISMDTVIFVILAVRNVTGLQKINACNVLIRIMVMIKNKMIDIGIMVDAIKQAVQLDHIIIHRAYSVKIVMMDALLVILLPLAHNVNKTNYNTTTHA